MSFRLGQRVRVVAYGCNEPELADRTGRIIRAGLRYHAVLLDEEYKGSRLWNFCYDELESNAAS